MLQELASHIEILQRGQASLRQTVEALRRKEEPAGVGGTAPTSASPLGLESAEQSTGAASMEESEIGGSHDTILDSLLVSVERHVWQQRAVQGEFEAWRLDHIFKLHEPARLFACGDPTDLPRGLINETCHWCTANALFDTDD